MCMLMRFSVSNYMSFGYKENENGEVLPDEFYLYAGSSQQFKSHIANFNGRSVLKFASIYGANASGKSNLIRAIDCGKRIVLSTLDAGKLGEKYCRNEKKNKDLPTLFEYEFTIQKKCYAYGFTVNLQAGEVLTEWLYELKGSKEVTIFERLAEQNAYYFDEEMFTKENALQFHYYIEDSNRIKNSLLLYELERRKLEQEDFKVFRQIYEWFQKKLIVIYPETKFGASYLHFEKTNDNLKDILKYLDTGITNYHMDAMNESAFREYFADSSFANTFLKKLKNNDEIKKSILCYGDTLFEFQYENDNTNIWKLQFKHGDDENYYEYGEESDGTQRLIELLEIILNDDDENVFVIDELDRSFHPQMTIKFVETFLEFSQNTNAQLIITTHESNLMDLDILRRDEIWFAEKEFDNTTTLYTLEKFKVRYDKVIAKDYLAGRYGAVPIFKDFEYVWGRNDV